MILGIEIGGTKLQLGVGDGRQPEFSQFRRLDIDRAEGAAGIRAGIVAAGRELLESEPIQLISYGFGGPVNRTRGVVVTSHQVSGWTGFPLADWTRQEFGVPAVLGNDCDVATLAEATFGAGQGQRTVFYVTVGTGIGGGLVIDGVLHGSDRPAIAEIGHLRPGPDCREAADTVESISAGPGIEQAARQMIERGEAGAAELLAGDHPESITTVQLAAAAEAGNPLARKAIARAVRTLGWAIAQMTTLIAPDIVVVGGGVALMPESLFLNRLRTVVTEYSFGPLVGACPVVTAALGEEVVVHGAILNAAQHMSHSGTA